MLSHVPLDGVCYFVTDVSTVCIGLVSVSLLKVFDVVYHLCTGDVTMTDE